MADLTDRRPVHSMQDVGTAIRRERRRQGLTLADAAGLCHVGTRFLSELENGKPTARCDRVLHVLRMLGLRLELVAPATAGDPAVEEEPQT